MRAYRVFIAVIQCAFFFQACLFTAKLPADGVNRPVVCRTADVGEKLQTAKSRIGEIRGLVLNLQQNQPQPQQPAQPQLQWNRYTTDNFEVLSLDDAQGKYLCSNIEYIKTWTLWRWGIKDFDFPSVKNSKGDTVKVKCKLICVPSADLYEKLFNRKTPSWRVEVKDGVPEYTVWFITEGTKWNTNLPVLLTEVVIANFEASTGSKFPVWCHRGMSVLNGRIEDIRARLSLVGGFDSKSLFAMTPEAYTKLDDTKKATFDAQAAFFCLWARQEFNGKVFLDFLGGAMINPEYSLRLFNIATCADCDSRVKLYASKLATGSDYYFSW